MRKEDMYLDGNCTTGEVDFIYKKEKIEMLDIDNDEKHREYITYFFRLLVDMKGEGTQKQLSKELNLSKGTVSRWYRTNKKGNSKIPSYYFMDLARFFDICPTWFYSVDIYYYFDSPNDGEKYKLNEERKNHFLTHLGKWKYQDIEIAIQKKRFLGYFLGDMYIEYAKANGYGINKDLKRWYDNEEIQDMKKGEQYFIRSEIWTTVFIHFKMQKLIENSLEEDIDCEGRNKFFNRRSAKEEKRRVEFCIYNSQCDIEEHERQLELLLKMKALGIAEEERINIEINNEKKSIKFFKEHLSKYESKLQEFTNITSE